jgi:hypothetical protein
MLKYSIIQNSELRTGTNRILHHRRTVQELSSFPDIGTKLRKTNKEIQEMTTRNNYSHKKTLKGMK